MNKITIAEIKEATGGRILSGDGTEEITAVSTDSRKVKAGELFVPIVGEVHDAHKFIPMAYENGCRAFLTDREAAAANLPEAGVILVKDTTRAMQALASWYLKKLNLKTVAVTGSVGKTSTRDMVCAILREKYITGTTVGNFNNDIGVPQTIFTFDKSMEAAVLEVGMDHRNEIHRLVDIIRPNVGIITNVGISHIENLGSREEILAAKLEITDYFHEGNTLIINQDNDMLQTAVFSEAYDVIRVGTDSCCDYFVHHIEDRGGEGVAYTLTVRDRDYRIQLAIPGAHNALNSALAAAAASCFGITAAQAAEGLSKLQLTGKRLTIRKAGAMKIIDDTYNAAPDSMKSALETLIHTAGGRKVAILAGMNELGENSPAYHREIGQFAAEQKVDLLLTAGEKAADIAEGAISAGAAAVKHFDTKEDLSAELRVLLKSNDTVLVKGSRAMEMEQIVDKIMKEQE
ncbi:UDP-N-acetylmuramoyl-tripeptide--D-alanyl-D-alanine ligase [Ihubacter sp. rT4E-8]|uniref:UDP-N-acetylmuramoyl-tripeptide--D-alanyl-D- alanine ligase n=1 Tax=Ihubacter sp. rT4E-8 TaxID=3242369 RepID=UPI003CF8927B